MLGGAILVVLVLVALFAPVITVFDPYEPHVQHKYAGPGTLYAATGQRFWLGADHLGRDLITRLVYGTRISLFVSLLSVSVGVTLGALIGIISVYAGAGWIDWYSGWSMP